MSIEFARPGFLYLLLLLPFWSLLVWPWFHGGVLYAGTEAAEGTYRWSRIQNAILFRPILLRLGAMVCLIGALAGPERVTVAEEMALRGSGIALAVDISTSMLTVDMEDENSRLSVAREAAIRFTEGRTLDELSLVAFAGQATTRVPPTTDPRLIIAGVESLEPQLVFDGTNISEAVLTATTGLLDSGIEPRVVVLLTDGAHNGQGIGPLSTARASAALGVRVHSIALLSELDLEAEPTTAREAAILRRRETEAEMETVLTAISRITGGEYFRAPSAAALDSIYAEINEIEAPVEELVVVEERAPLGSVLLLAGLFLMALDAGLRGSRWGLLP